MSCILKIIPFHHTHNYLTITNKDDDFEIARAKAWVGVHPVEEIEQVKAGGLKEINNYATKIIKELKLVPVTSANISILKTHLVGMGKQCDVLKQALLEKIKMRHIQGEKALIEQIWLGLA